MEQIATYLGFFCIIVIMGQVFNKLAIPLALLLVVAGMLLSFIPHFATISLNPNLVLNIFLPILIYQISAFSSWKDFKKNMRPIALLSVGHVIFITIIVAIVINKLIPQLGWPLAIVIGAVVSPPDDVAIVSIAEKIRMPSKVINILEGEGMLNDAAALILFRFALAAVLTHKFLLINAVSTFILVIVAETVYGLVLGFLLGELRLKIKDPSLHVIASLLTPFLAYYPAEWLGGSGVIAVVTTGFVIGHFYGTRFTPQFRLISRAMWPAIAFGIQSLLFLLVGLDMRSIVKSISPIPIHPLLIYVSALIATVIIGRFIWVYLAGIYIPKLILNMLGRREPGVRWQFPLLISWSGMRGSVSLAAALAVPFLPGLVNGADVRGLLIFLVFTVIIATLLLQGFALPWLIKLIDVEKISVCEEYKEHITELKARKAMADAVLHWLFEYKKQVKADKRLYEEVKTYIEIYKMLKLKLKDRLVDHANDMEHDEEREIAEDTSLQLRLIEIERNKLLELWRNEKINLKVREKLLDQIDHHARNIK